MKKAAAAVLALGLVFLLCGCQGKPLPEGMDDEAVLEAGREIVVRLNEGDWQGIFSQMRSDGQEKASPEAIQEIMESVLDRAGELKKETDAMVTGQTLKETGEEYGTAVFYYKHAKKRVQYRIAFSQDMELMGLSVDTR